MASDVCVCIPWRPQPDRINARNRVLAFWEHHGFDVIEADSDPGLPFSVPQARNNAVRQATAEQVIVAGADTIPDIGAVLQALNHRDGVCWPYNVFRHIPGSYVDKADLMTAPVDREYGRSVGGIFVTTVQEYWRLGGMDERLERCWGYDDSCFGLVVQTLSRVHRVPGIVFSFNHAVDRDMTANRARWMLYKLANGKPELMQELIKV